MATFARPPDLVVAFARALNAKDADKLGELFTDDAEFVNIMGMRMRRRQGIVDGHGWAFAGPLRGRRIRFDQVDELRVTDDVTVLIGHCVCGSVSPMHPWQVCPTARRYWSSSPVVNRRAGGSSRPPTSRSRHRRQAEGAGGPKTGYG